MARTLPRRYPILDDATHVPTWVWKRSDLVVERFTPEREATTTSCGCGSFSSATGEYVVKMSGPRPVVKTFQSDRIEPITEVPDSLRRRRAEMGADYGKFDFVIVDGEAILLDANKTPTLRQGDGPDRPNITRLAAGIHHYVAAG